MSMCYIVKAEGGSYSYGYSKIVKVFNSVEGAEKFVLKEEERLKEYGDESFKQFLEAKNSFLKNRDDSFCCEVSRYRIEPWKVY